MKRRSLNPNAQQAKSAAFIHLRITAFGEILCNGKPLGPAELKIRLNDRAHKENLAVIYDRDEVGDEVPEAARTALAAVVSSKLPLVFTNTFQQEVLEAIDRAL